MADLQLVESLFTSIDTIVNKRIENLPYDKTITATVENIDNAANGIYIVNDGTTTFEAYSENDSYTVGTKVYVNIPKGDYHEQKNIIGKYVNDDSSTYPIGYTDPMKSYLDITNNLFENENNEFYLIANGETKEIELWKWVAADDNSNPLAGFDTLGISGSFQSLVGRNKTIIEGQYGLRLDIIAVQNNSARTSTATVTYSIYLDSSQFFGDPYNFETFYEQSKVLNLSDKNIDRVDGMRLIFYQNKNFKNDNKELITPVEQGYDLAVNNIYISLGYNLDNYSTQDNSLILYTFDSTTYTNSISTNIRNKYSSEYDLDTNEEDIATVLKEVNQKTLHCRWIHKDEDGNLACYGTNYNDLPETATIKWYRYVWEEQEDTVVDPPGNHWKEIEDTENLFDIEVDPYLNKYKDAFKVVLWNPSSTYIQEQLESDSEYIDLTREQQVALNCYINYDPMELLRLYFDNTTYAALALTLSENAAEQFNNEIIANISSQIQNITEDTELSAAEKDDAINEIIEENKDNIEEASQSILTTTSTATLSDQNAIYYNKLASIKKHLSNYTLYYFVTQETASDINSQLEADLFINTDTGFFSYAYNNGYWKKRWNNSDFYQIYQDYADENADLLKLKTKTFNFLDGNYASEPLIKHINDLDAEFNKDADTRSDENIKSLFEGLRKDIDTFTTSYTETFKTQMTPDATWLSNEDNEYRLRYEQISDYEYYFSLYSDQAIEITNIESSYTGQIVSVTSDILEFTNEDPTSWVEFESIKNLTLEVDITNQGGNYALYNDEGYIINDSEASIARKITAKYTTVASGDSSIDVAEKITWKIPIDQTMIVYPEEGIEYNLYEVASPTSINFSLGTYYTYSNTNDKYELATGDWNENTTYYIRNDVEVSSDDNYFYIVQNMPMKDNKTYGEEEANSTEICFRINSMYLPNAKNNTITCTVLKGNKPLEAETTLTFSPQGLMGTDYTFMLQLDNNQQALIVGAQPVRIIAKVLDYNGKDITSQVGTINYEWYKTNDKYNVEDNAVILNTETVNDITYHTLQIKEGADIDDCAHYILKAYTSNIVQVKKNINDDEDTTTLGIKLETYFPIIVEKSNIYGGTTTYITDASIKETLNNLYQELSSLQSAYEIAMANTEYTEEERQQITTEYNNSITSIQSNINTILQENTYSVYTDIIRYDGSPIISYDTAGTNPQYYKDSFQLYGWDSFNGKSKVISDVEWDVLYTKDCYNSIYNEDTEEYEDVLNKNYYPYLSEEDSLIVPSIYLETSNNNEEISLRARIKNEGSDTYDNTIFIIPLYIKKRVYSSTFLNSWDGSLTLDQENGTIISTMMGAGYKDDQNLFNGIIMGEMDRVDTESGDLLSEYYFGTGLYGYNEGEKAFGFNINGYGFIGRNGAGQILFDGNSGIIQSANYAASTYSQDGSTTNVIGSGTIIDLANGFIETDNAILRDGCCIGGASETDGAWKIENGKIYTQYTDSSSNTTKYMGIGIQNKAWAFYAGASNISGSDGIFRVGHNGKLYASNATIVDGTINVGSGSIIATKQGLSTEKYYIWTRTKTDGSEQEDDFSFSNWTYTAVDSTKNVSVNISAGQIKISADYTNPDLSAKTWTITSTIFSAGEASYYDSEFSNPALQFSGGDVNFSHSVSIGKSLYVTNHLEVEEKTSFGSSIEIFTGGLYCYDLAVAYNVASMSSYTSTSSTQAVFSAKNDYNNRKIKIHTSSSKRYKENIIKFSLKENNLLEKIYNNINLYIYKYKKDYLTEEDERFNLMIPGFISEEWDSILPIAVDHTKEGLAEKWNNDIIIPLMFQMIKNNHEEIQQLQQENKILKEKIYESK